MPGDLARLTGMTPSARLVELSHVLEDGMVTYPGLPGPLIGVHLSREDSRAVYAPGTEFEIGRISMVANTGTYLDTPLHRFPDGADLAETPLEKVAALPAVRVDLRGGPEHGIDEQALAGLQVGGAAVLLHTGWSQHWRTERYAVQAPFLTADGARWLAEQGATLVGIDSINIDDMADRTRPAHTILLAAGIPVLEHLTGLDAVPASGFTLHAAPVRVRGMGTFPVRAYAVVPPDRHPE
jgi:arylformamidase